MRIVLELPEKLVEILKKLSENSGKTLEGKIGEILLEYTKLLDPEDKVELHLKLCEKYLRKAEELVRKGDHVQASEKAWDATAQIVKAIAAKRGLELRSHRDLWEFVEKLAEETRDEELRRLWHIANSLHINFYEAWAPPQMVISGVKDIEKLIDKLKKLIQ